MKYIKRNKFGDVEAASDVKFDDSYELANEEYDVGFDGRLYSASEMQGAEYLAQKAKFDDEMKKAVIRARRDVECFPIINRGVPWHDRLSAEQKRELNEWYAKWCDAPDTKIIPAKLDWVDKVLK